MIGQDGHVNPINRVNPAILSNVFIVEQGLTGGM